MKKKTQKKKSILTLPLQGVILTQLEKIKIISGEKTSAGAIRYAINLFPRKVEQVDSLTKQLRECWLTLELKQEAINVILKSVKTLTNKKATP